MRPASPAQSDITRIRLDGEGCRALSSSIGGDEHGEKLDISHCRPESK
jgi:hypothetical protein